MRSAIKSPSAYEPLRLGRMNTLAQQFARVERLAEVAQSNGFTLWQLQELEGVAASYFVLIAQAEKGMGTARGNALVEKAQSKTFGATLRQIAKAGLVSPEIVERFMKLLAERNWLVHRSRADSRNVIHNDEAINLLLARLDAMAGESLALLNFIDVKTTAFVRSHSISMDYIAEVSKQLLEQWHASKPL